jgi:hypothetical protein
MHILDMLNPHILPAHFEKSLERRTLGRKRNVWRNLSN